MFIQQFLKQVQPVYAWFLEIAFLRDVSMSVCVRACVCVSTPEAINYIHMILYLHNQLNKFET